MTLKVKVIQGHRFMSFDSRKFYINSQLNKSCKPEITTHKHNEIKLQTVE